MTGCKILSGFFSNFWQACATVRMEEAALPQLNNCTDILSLEVYLQIRTCRWLHLPCSLLLCPDTDWKHPHCHNHYLWPLPPYPHVFLSQQPILQHVCATPIVTVPKMLIDTWSERSSSPLMPVGTQMFFLALRLQIFSSLSWLMIGRPSANRCSTWQWWTGKCVCWLAVGSWQGTSTP